MGLPTDRDLLLRVPEDRAAFEEFYRRNAAVVGAFAARRCDRTEDVADVVAGTFLGVLREAARYDPRRGVPRAWLLAIASREVFAIRHRTDDERGAAARFARFSVLSDDEVSLLKARIDAERLSSAVSAALATASPTEREMFLLVVYDDLTPSEAASVLGISAVAGRTRLSAVRRRLQRAAQLPPPSPSPAAPNPNLEEMA